MAIKKINNIKNYGIFKNFRWSASVPEFKKYNLFYGWNYSGKTTLSRIFRSFEVQEKHLDYPNAEFELEDESGSMYKQTDLTSLPKVRVFNQDFIGKNLKWYSSEESIEPIFLLGEQSVELQSQLEDKKVEIEKLKTNHSEIKLAYETEEEAIKKAESDCARQIKQQLAIPDLDVRHLRTAIASLEENADPLTEEECEIQLNNWRSSDKMEVIQLPQLPQINASLLFEEVEKILATVVSGKPIEKLKNDAKLEGWVQVGLSLHEHEQQCQFCNNNVSDARRTELSEHFSEDYKQLQNQLTQTSQKITSLKKSFNDFLISLPDDSRFYSDLRPSYQSNKKRLSKVVAEGIVFLDWLIEQLNLKQSKPFEAMGLDETNKKDFALQSTSDSLVEVIDNHNKKTSNFEEEKEKAKEKLFAHYTGEFIERENYKDRQQGIKDKKKQYSEGGDKMVVLEKEKLAIETQLSDSLKGAAKVNDYITLLFQHDGIKIEVTPENMFVLKRNSFSAENLSEGEKTAISFAYFITCLEDKNTNLAETIIFVDDPISSLDSNHLFNIYSFIKNKLSNSGQLFISTHNLEFFNLLKDWLKDKNEVPAADRSFYLVRRIQKQGNFESVLEILPSQLQKFKSEYHYLFAVMKDFDTAQDDNFDQLYQMPNITRRFLEAYLGFRIPNQSKPLRNLLVIIDDETERTMVYKFINEYSHNESTTRALVFPDFSECSKVVKVVLNAIQTKDQSHYDALCENC